jgi:hypothetical protein
VLVDKLPMISSVRLTPDDGRSIRARLKRRMSTWTVAMAAGVTLAVGGAGALWFATTADAQDGTGVVGRATLAMQWSKARRMRIARDSARVADSLAIVKARADSLRVAAAARASRASVPDVAAAGSEGAPKDGGKVRLRVYPSTAQIFVDDRLLGTGIVYDSVLAPGTRRLRVSAQGFAPVEMTFEVTGGEITSLSPITLKPREGGE